MINVLHIPHLPAKTLISCAFQRLPFLLSKQEWSNQKMDGSEKSTRGRSMKLIRQLVILPFLRFRWLSFLLSLNGSNKSHWLLPNTFLSLRVFLLGHAGYCQIYDAFRLDIICTICSVKGTWDGSDEAQDQPSRTCLRFQTYRDVGHQDGHQRSALSSQL
jgi:hypothetical protein